MTPVFFLHEVGYGRNDVSGLPFIFFYRNEVIIIYFHNFISPQLGILTFQHFNILVICLDEYVNQYTLGILKNICLIFLMRFVWIYKTVYTVRSNT